MKTRTFFKRPRRVIYAITILVISVFLTNNANASDYSDAKVDSVKVPKEVKNALSTCPGGVAFGIFSVNYERLLAPNHGLVLRADYEMIPKTYSDAKIESSGYAFIMNYRYHFSGQMNSLFAGVYSRYRTYLGEGSLDGTDFEFTIPDVTVGVNLGRKWVWKSGFTMTAALGYGFSKDWTKVDHTTEGIEKAISSFEKEYKFLSPFLGEFSIGYSF